jgi:hypothetical protein
VKKEEVPQDQGLQEGHPFIRYAVNENGEYEKVKSLGWSATNAASNFGFAYLNRRWHQAWEVASRGERSPLHYYMTLRMMEPSVVARYMGSWTWTVRRHLRPSVWARLSEEVLARYAALFKVRVEQMRGLEGPNPHPIPAEDL